MMRNPIPQIDRELRSEFLLSEEGKVFVLGCCMLILWVEAMAMFWALGHPMWINMLTVGLAHVVAGRAASIAHGTQAGLSPWLISFLATYADTMAMLIMFPILIFGYQHFVENLFFQRHMKPMFDSAQKNMPRLRRFKILGVFCFVFIPFWMTGIIAGSVLGYLLGLRTWINMATVILGSAAAVISWVFAYDKMFGWLAGIHQGIPVIISIGIILGVIIARLAGRRRKR